MLCRELRELSALRLPFIFILSEQTASYCEIEAFRSGADDFIIKPINPEVFKMRLNAFLQRSIKISNLLGNPFIINIDDLRIDTNYYLVYLGNKNLSFTKKEVEVLALLAKNPDKVFSREQIIQAVWKDDIVNSSITVDVRIHNIRQKIGESRIKTVKNVGYKFVKHSQTSN